MRTFRHKVTINDAGAIVVFGLGSFSCLWNRTNSLMILLGVLLVVVTIRAVDRAIHTEYVLTGEDRTGRPDKTDRTEEDKEDRETSVCLPFRCLRTDRAGGRKRCQRSA